eukprot:jgi/Bigna1/75125/fgenesh1_pg.32_\
MMVASQCGESPQASPSGAEIGITVKKIKTRWNILSTTVSKRDIDVCIRMRKNSASSYSSSSPFSPKDNDGDDDSDDHHYYLASSKDGGMFNILDHIAKSKIGGMQTKMEVTSSGGLHYLIMHGRGHRFILRRTIISSRGMMVHKSNSQNPIMRNYSSSTIRKAKIEILYDEGYSNGQDFSKQRNYLLCKSLPIPGVWKLQVCYDGLKSPYCLKVYENGFVWYARMRT